MSEEKTEASEQSDLRKLLDLEGMMARAFERTNSIGDEAQRNFISGLMLGFARSEVQRVADAMAQKSAQAYQVIGNLLDRSNAFESDAGQRALDYFSEEHRLDEDFLPWPRQGEGDGTKA